MLPALAQVRPASDHFYLSWRIGHCLPIVSTYRRLARTVRLRTVGILSQTYMLLSSNSSPVVSDQTARTIEALKRLFCSQFTFTMVLSRRRSWQSANGRPFSCAAACGVSRSSKLTAAVVPGCSDSALVPLPLLVSLLSPTTTSFGGLVGIAGGVLRPPKLERKFMTLRRTLEGSDVGINYNETCTACIACLDRSRQIGGRVPFEVQAMRSLVQLN